MKYFLLLLLLPLPLIAFITSISTMQEARAHCAANHNSLVIFDVEMTLLQPSNPAFQPHNMQKYKATVRKTLLSLKAEKKDIFLTLIHLDSPPLLVDLDTPSFVQELHKDHIPTIAVTSSLTGAFDEFDSLETVKIQQLRECGLDFTLSTPYEGDIIFSTLPTHRNNYAVYTQGVLFCNGINSKGKTVRSFFAKLKLYPKKIVFIDDNLRDLQEIEGILTQMEEKIEFVGLHFVGAENYPSPPIAEKAFIREWQQLGAQTE